MANSKPANDRNHVEVAHLSGPAGIRAAFEMLRGDEGRGNGLADSPKGAGRTTPSTPQEPHLPCGADPFDRLVTTSEEVPDIHWTCNHCAADNPPDEQICWCCGAQRRTAPRPRK